MRLGHTSDVVLKHIPSLNLSSICDNDCPVCPSAKQTMLAFPKTNNSYASTCFHLLHLDLWGPYHVQSSSGCKYFLTVVNDHSRAT